MFNVGTPQRSENFPTRTKCAFPRATMEPARWQEAVEVEDTYLPTNSASIAARLGSDGAFWLGRSGFLLRLRFCSLGGGRHGLPGAGGEVGHVGDGAGLGRWMSRQGKNTRGLVWRGVELYDGGRGVSGGRPSLAICTPGRRPGRANIQQPSRGPRHRHRHSPRRHSLAPAATSPPIRALAGPTTPQRAPEWRCLGVARLWGGAETTWVSQAPRTPFN